MSCRTLLAAIAALAPAIAAAQVIAPTSVAAADVRAACREIEAGCEEKEAALGDLCKRLTSDPPRQADWSAATYPTVKQVAEALSCKADKRGRQGVPAQTEGSSATFYGASQSAVLWGTADFLVGRAEEELRAWAVDRFLQSVCEGPEGVLGGERMLPETCRVAQGIHLRGFMFGLGALREAARADLRHLPTLAFAEAARKADPTRPEAADVALVAWQASRTAERLLAGVPAPAALGAVAEDAAPRALSCGDKGTPAAALLFQVAALTRTLQSEEGTRELTLPQSTKAWNAAFLALAVNHTSDPAIAGNWPACPEGGSAGFQVETLYTLTAGLQAGLVMARAAAADLQRLPATADAATRRQIYGLAVGAGVGALRAVIGDLPGLAAQARMLAQTQDIARDIAVTSYSAVLAKLSWALAAAWAQQLWPEDFQRLAAFVTDVAEAKSAEAVSVAIARAAEPVGGYRRKRAATAWYLGVNGYFGLAGGVEWAKSGTPDRAQAGTSIGFWAPMGLEVGRAWGGWSCGLFLQAVDLGVLASWRLAHDDLSSAPEVSARQVFSPGAFLVVGFPRAPVAASLGLAFAPKLRALLDSTGAVERDRDAIRLGLAVAVDILIFD